MKIHTGEREEARERLLEWLKPGDTVYTILRHVSASGMTRHISVVKPYVREGDGEIDFLHLDYNVARALGEREARNRLGGRDGIKVGGCGMDMGFHLVYSLSRALWPEGHECIGTGCPANDHTNGDRDYTPHHHNDGGYCLNQRWL